MSCWYRFRLRTSQVRTPLAFAETLVVDWQAANLLKASVVKLLLATLEQSLVIRQLGAFSAGDQIALKNALTLILG